MPRIPALIQQTNDFHMKTRSRAMKATSTPEPTTSSAENSPLSSALSSPSAPPPKPARSRKRKARDATSDDSERRSRGRRPSLQVEEDGVGENKIDFGLWKERQLWPEFDPENPIFYAKDGTTRYHPGETGDTSESRSPRKPARGGARNGGRSVGHGNSSGRGKGKQRGKGRAGGSPEPPNRQRPLTQDDRVLISMLKARQHELKRFFTVVGAQQVDILDQLASRDLSKLARKPKVHKHVPEFDAAMEELEARMKDAEDLARTRYTVQLEHEMQRLDQEKEVIDQQFKTHITEARKEHLAGAEGDIILFEGAYRAAHDDTHTESGSDLDYFPHYHELPEADRQPRGYVSSKIMDEKPFKQQLASFDEQARQEVLNEDVIGPLLKQMEQRNNEWREELIRKKSQNIDALSGEATKELEQMRGYLIPRPFNVMESNSYALSALADVSDWVAQQHPDPQYIYMPPAPGDTFPRQGPEFSPVPGQSYQVVRPDSSNRRAKYPLSAPPNSLPPPSSAPPTATKPATPPFLPRIVPSGPGQPIAPAPPKPATRSSGPSIFRHSIRSGSQSSPLLSNGPQQFIFQPPQQPLQYQAAPGPDPTPKYGPAGQGAPVGQQTKIPMTFVNQTIASRNAAATGNGNMNVNAKGGQRILLPKVGDRRVGYDH